jgi:hypothetical protein
VLYPINVPIDDDRIINTRLLCSMYGTYDNVTIDDAYGACMYGDRASRGVLPDVVRNGGDIALCTV